MDKLTAFTYNLIQLLLKEKKNGKLSDLSQDDIYNISPLCDEIDGELRYYIDKSINDKLDEDIINEIEALWILD